MTRNFEKNLSGKHIIKMNSKTVHELRKGAYRSFVIPGALKTDIDSYFDQTKP